MTHPNEEIARRAFQALHIDRDDDAISQYFAEDLEYHLGGDSAVSGDRKGRAALIAGMDQISALGIKASYDLHDVVANDEHAVMLISSHLERDGKAPYEQPAVWVAHVRDGKITEIWSFLFNQAAVKEFVS
jgi:uncharacterized protein